MSSQPKTAHAVVIGAGPAGLMAAEVLAAAGLSVDVYEAMPSAGRKFLMAGKGGMNITHAEPFAAFAGRYGDRQLQIEPLLANFGANTLRAWIHDLGIETFVGSSGRVFPTDMKAAPLLRRWLHRLRESGVRLHMRHRWTGWNESGELCFDTPTTPLVSAADITVLALGGGSWARLGSDGKWLPLLSGLGVQTTRLQPSNCGFECDWSEHLRHRQAGAALKAVTISMSDSSGSPRKEKGDCIVTEHGIEGGVIYMLSACIREAINRQGQVTLQIDLLPDLSHEKVLTALRKPRGSRTLTHQLQNLLGLKGAKLALVYELTDKATQSDPAALAAAIKSLPLVLARPRPIDEAISTAGGVCFEGLDQNLMIRTFPGVFCAGEMLDWEAPTGGYLLTACFSTGRAAAEGALAWWRIQ